MLQMEVGMTEQLREVPDSTTELQSQEEQLEMLRGRIDELMVAGNAVARQLREHGDHQANFYGHSPDCRTCSVDDDYRTAVTNITETLSQLFPPSEDASGE
jgi:DNA-binding LacI/PurR family transcriptional regulator